MQSKYIYLDHAATSPLLERVAEKMYSSFEVCDGNPSSLHSLGIKAFSAVKDSRDTIAECVGCDPESLFFTSGGSEANSWALVSSFLDAHEKDRRREVILVPEIEHHSVLRTCEYLERYYGAIVEYLPVDSQGFVNMDYYLDVLDDIDGHIAVVAIMAVNNEVGTIEPVNEVYQLAIQRGIPKFHVDCVQAFCHADLNGRLLDEYFDRTKYPNITASVSAHKIGGPKGIGFLYSAELDVCPSYIFGGGQERKRRGGTENILGIIGFAEAVKANYDDALWKNVGELPKAMMKIVGADAVENGPSVFDPSVRQKRISNSLNVSFTGVKGEELQAMLDMRGICVSTGSACNSLSGKPSHVLKAMGLEDDAANSAIRFSFDHRNSIEDVIDAAYVVKECVELLKGENRP